MNAQNVEGKLAMVCRFVSGLQPRIWVVAVLLAASGCGTLQYDPITGREIRNFYTIDGDAQFGLNVKQDILKATKEAGIPINQDPVMLNTLSNMMQRIAAVSHFPELPYSVTLIHTNIVNAACAPGGQLFFWEGLYDPEEGLVQAEDKNELAAVMGHEIAHATARHTTRRMTQTMPINVALLAGALAAELTDNEDWALVLGGAFVLYQGLVLPRYSRADEYEADRIGLFYMAQAGYDPRAAPRIWQRAHQRHGDPGLMQYLASHPTHRKRSRELERLMPEAMELYRNATGHYPPGYTAYSYYTPPSHQPSATEQWWAHWQATQTLSADHACAAAHSVAK